ncbi:MAG: phosphoribosylamine--glycine ligase [Parasphingorhabdus sp.]|jgi:phosphoribosylamine--glycine ligase
MKVLVVGGGGREHALAWKVAQSPKVRTVFVAPGNAGTAIEPGVINVQIDAEDIDGLLVFAIDNQIDLTIIGPEAPLVAGIVDCFNAAGKRCFGPDKYGAQLEGSKAFTKAFLEKYSIPTAAYRDFSDLDDALAYIRKQGAPIVIKADGLAAGKGVVLADSISAAENAAREMLQENRFGDAGAKIVVEEFLHGEEASFICIAGGNEVLPMASSQDHKARDDGDTGPNTGGMGAYSPAPVVDEAMHERIMQQIIHPTIAGLKQEGIDYHGFLYAGVMIDSKGTPKVLEYNCRFGDPETQPILLRLQSDLVDLIEAALNHCLSEISSEWDSRASLGVVMVAGGYPSNYSSGEAIQGIEQANSDSRKVFHAGTRVQGNELLTSGGRVLCVTALGTTVTEAQANAYAGCDHIDFSNAYYRNDIGHRAISREKSNQTRPPK